MTVGWFGFNVMSAQKLHDVSGLVALNSLMAMAGGTLAALIVGRNDPGFVHNGPLAGLVAICAGSDLMNPIGALIVGSVAGADRLRRHFVARWKLYPKSVIFPLPRLKEIPYKPNPSFALVTKRTTKRANRP